MRTQLDNNGEAFIALHAYLGECRIGGLPFNLYHSLRYDLFGKVPMTFIDSSKARRFQILN